MPENPHPTPSPLAPGEFSFVDSATQQPRLKRRNLKAPSAPAPVEAEPPPVPADEPEPDSPRSTFAPPPRSTPAPSRTFPASTSSSTPAPASGLYYSTGPRPEKEETPMKTSTPTASSSTSAATAPASSYRSAGSASTTSRPASLSDYRANIDRQAREQKSVGGILAIFVYVFVGFSVLSAGLAGYGGYTLSRQIHAQSVTVSDLDAHFTTQIKTLNTALDTTDENLEQAQGQIRRQQEIIIQQQVVINKLVTANDNTVSALRQERQVRANETADLEAEVKKLETQPRFGP